MHVVALFVGRYGDETHSTLKFASKAKTIQNCTQVNEVLDDAALMRRYKKEISELRTQLASSGERKHRSASPHCLRIMSLVCRPWR